MKRISDLCLIRNQLIHYGQIPDQDNVIKDATVFIKTAEWIILRVLGLKPKDVFNTIDELEKFLIGSNSAKNV